METFDYPQYTYQHDTTGVIYKVCGIPAKEASHEYLLNMLSDIGLHFPEGMWSIIGVKTYKEVW